MTAGTSPIVVALGGNAISPERLEGNIEQQYSQTRTTAVRLGDLVQAGHHLVITHGNGPQVGNVLRRVELAAHEVYRLPLDTCVADTQAGMGYMIATCLNNELHRRGIERTVSTIVTTVEVDPDDPAFRNPTKPIGVFYPRERGEELKAQYGWQMVEIPRRGLRRVVPSPLPQRILEIDLIRRLAGEGELLVAAGGGGIPVVRGTTARYVGCEAVIDKDLTSSLLARAIGASTFLVVTSTPRVALHFGTPAERWLDRLTISEARRYLAEGHFPPGSMGPKIEAGIQFLDDSRRGDARFIICDVDQMAATLEGRGGTRMEPG